MIVIPKGTKDVLPSESYKWHYIEEKIREVAGVFGLKEIRTPTFEHTDLFLRGVGETTDIVNKEMYTFNDKGGRSITLKPEGTAGVARSYIENNLGNLPQPIKMYYLTPVFRYERPQSGRFREHHQFGVEIYGSDSPLTDVETILIAKNLLDKLEIDNVELNINSIGCKGCRKEYNKALTEYLKSHIQNMCKTCGDRLEKNPLRILDCKEEKCTIINADAPKIMDYLCLDCKNHHQKVEETLTNLEIRFVINPKIVRGLDYYTRTVFEFISKSIGSQGTVCGGGRYNNLVEEIGGKPTPAVGFGMGLERLIMVAESMGKSLGEDKHPHIYIAPMGDEQYKVAYKLVANLREKGIYADADLMGRSLRAQMKYADKQGAKYVVVLGEQEIETQKIKLKNMKEGKEIEIELSALYENLI